MTNQEKKSGLRINMKFTKTFIYALVILAGVIILSMLFKKKSIPELFMASPCEGTDKPYTLIAFFMDGCGHCTQFKPEWQKFKDQASSQSWGSKVCVAELDGNDPDVTSRYNVRAFPTVLLFNNGTGGNPKDFDQDRSVSGLNAFLSSNVN